MDKTIAILVATHKLYEVPTSNLYLPVYIGKKDNPNVTFQRDDVGNNIADKNFSYCELTAVYWAWKNLDSDYYGLCHYRRYFKGDDSFVVNSKKIKIISKNEAYKYLGKYDLILPKKRRYYIETNEQQYLHAHHKEGLEETYNVIKEFYPEYGNSLKKVMNSRSGHRFNMFIMKKDLFNNYCNWLFDILSRVEKRIDISNWDKSEQRVFGYLSERLLDVWVDFHKINYKELKVVFTEKQHIIKKGINFVLRKFRKKKF